MMMRGIAAFALGLLIAYGAMAQTAATIAPVAPANLPAVTTSAQGAHPTLNNVANNCLNGQGSYIACGGSAPAYFTYTVTTGAYAVTLSSSSTAPEVSHIWNAGSTATTSAITLPATPGPDGQIINLANNSGASLGTVTISANSGQTLGTGNGVTTITAGAAGNGSNTIRYQWLLGVTKWQRIQ